MLGLSHIPEDRHKTAIDDFSIKENLILGVLDPYSKNGIIDFKSVSKSSNRLIDKFDIRPADENSIFGGTIWWKSTKSCSSRELDKNNTFIIAAQPTRGLIWVQLKWFIIQFYVREKTKKAILLVSAELTEIMALSDKILVMYSGQIAGVLDRKDATIEKLGILMAGGKLDE